jgi:hypothetical protein
MAVKTRRPITIHQRRFMGVNSSLASGWRRAYLFLRDRVARSTSKVSKSSQVSEIEREPWTPADRVESRQDAAV